MTISFKRYISIDSGVGAGANVGNRQLIGRFFDDNSMIPTGSFITFDSADEVGAYFGTGSTEAARANFWFGWVSKEITDAKAMSFCRWNSAASAPQIFGAPGLSLTALKAITAGSFTLTLGGVTNTMSALDFSGAANLAAIAALVQTAIRTKTGSMWTAATVVYNSTRNSFDFVGGVVGAANIFVTAGTGGGDAAAAMGWLSAATILSPGGAIQTITQVLSQSAAADNNFGSFAFTATLTQDQIVEAATWNDTQNNQFIYSVPCTSSTASALNAVLVGLSGVTLTLAPISTEYPEQMPMMILASTNYVARNTTQNYMYQIFDITPSVTTDADADIYDALRVNYYGQTQTAGQLIQFYQRGFMMGLPSDARDQNTYANEIWLKDAAGAALMTLLLALTKVSANATGRAQILSILQGVINQARFNGTISVGKILTDTQKEFITQITGDNQSWKQVQNLGYWVDAVIVQEVISGVTEYKAVYTLIYSKDDVIRKIEGSDILI